MKGKAPRKSALLGQEILVNPADLNSSWRMRGGRLFDLADLKAAIVAQNHAECISNTVSGFFKYFISLDTATKVVLNAKITRAWNTSMEIRVDAYAKNMRGKKKRAFSIYFYFVAIKDDNPQPVPPVLPQTKSEKKEYQNAEERKKKVIELIGQYFE